MNTLNSFAIPLFFGISIALGAAPKAQDLLSASPAAPERFEALRILDEGGHEAETLRADLVQTLRSAETPAHLEMASDLLTRSRGDTGFGVLLERMNDAAPRMRVAAVRAIRKQLFRNVTITPDARRTARERLTAIVSDPTADRPFRLVALEALSGLGSEGFDVLVAALKEKRLEGLSGVYTAIGHTGDPRALTLLRDVIRDPERPDGETMQAIAAAAECLRMAKTAGHRLSAADISAWEESLKPLFNRDEQVTAEALKMWGQLHGPSKDPGFRRSVLAAITSESVVLQLAGLELIHAGMLPTDEEILAQVSRLGSGGKDVVRNVADAVLAKERLAQEFATP